MHEYSILNGITKVPFRKEYHPHERPKEKHNIETNNIMEIKTYLETTHLSFRRKKGTCFIF